MDDYEARVNEIHAQFDAASAALVELTTEVVAENADGLARTEKSLAFARTALDGSDPQFITATVAEAFKDASSSVSDDAAVAIGDGDAADALLAAALLLPVARGRDLEQTIKDAAATYQRAMAQRIRTLEEQIAGATDSLTNLGNELTSASEALKASIDELTTELTTRIDALDTAIAAHQATLDAQLTRHTTAFTAAEEDRATTFQAQTATFTATQEENAKKFEEQTAAFSEQVAAATKEASDEAEREVDKIRKIGEDVGVLAGAIALKETAERYADESSEQKKVADRFRKGAVAVTLGAAAVATSALFHQVDDTRALVAKLAISSALVGLATYLATQSGKHRAREARAKDLQLQMTAFNPFIAPLVPELQQVERVRMTRRTFGATKGDEDEEEILGPGFVTTVRTLLSRDEDTPTNPE